MKLRSLLVKTLDRLFLSIPLTIFLILLLGVLSLIGAFPSFRQIFQSRLFLMYLCSIVFMMLYCSIRRLPTLIERYSYNKKIFHFSQNKKAETSDFSLTRPKEILVFHSQNKNKLEAAESLQRLFRQKRYRKTAYCSPKKGEEKFFYEKGKLSIFGAQGIHLAIALLLLAGVITAWGGRFFDFSVAEGKTIPLEGTRAFLTLEKFSIIPSGSNEVADEYASRLRINHPGRDIKWYTLKVNKPLRIDGIRLYQSKFTLDIEKLKLAIFKENGRLPVKVLSLGIKERVSIPELDIAVELNDFMPDFSIDKNKKILNRSHLLKNPAGYLVAYSPSTSSSVIQEGWIFRGSVMPHKKQTDKEPRLQFMIGDIKYRYISGIKYVKNPAEVITYIGLTLLAVASFLSCSQFYRGLIITIKERIPGSVSTIVFEALPCKNIFSFEKEINAMVSDFSLETEKI